MGQFIWHEWARFVAISASIYGIWAGFWGLFYRKFFWDFIGGVRMNTATQKGIIPGSNSAPFIAIIVKIPLVQIMTILVGITILILEYPVPFVQKMSLYRSWLSRIVLLSIQAFLAILFYQGTNSAIWSTIAVIAYSRAQMKGERFEEAKANRGTNGAA